MATQGTRTGQTVVAGWTASASGVNNGGIAIGVGHEHVGGTSVMSSGLQLEQIADSQVVSSGSLVNANDGTGAATTDRVGVTKALSAGTLGFNPNKRSVRDDRSETWIMRGVTTKLSDVANTALLSRGRIGDSAYDNTHGTINHYVLGSGNGTFDINAVPSTAITPNYTKGAAAGDSATFVNPADGTAAVATEIFPSLSVPGELTYHFGGLGRPTTDEYKAKNSNE